jgi:Spherulation-specific family 4/Domain of unknown function (DUF4214)
MQRGFTRLLALTSPKLSRPHHRMTRRTALSLVGLEQRALLSLKGVGAHVMELIRPDAKDGEIRSHSPQAAKVNKQVKFVDSQYRTYFHRAPTSQELSFVLEQLAVGLSHKALTADFKAVTAKKGKGITNQAFVTALYVTIAAKTPTSVGFPYWEGLLASGDSRARVRQSFTASDALLPAPQVIWSDPVSITVGTALLSAQLDATASVPGTFMYTPGQGTVLGVGIGQKLSVVFTPADTADYPVVTDSVFINVTASTQKESSLGIIVPSYFAPGTGGPGGVGDGWAAMAAAAAKVPITAIFNPNSGPLPGPPSPAYAASFTQLEAAGGKVVAYVYTDKGNADGTAPLSAVEGEMSTYISQYGTLINGFLLDGTLITPSTLSYYVTLHSFIKGLSQSYTVLANPGQPYLNGVSPQNYLSTADVFNLFEGTSAGYSTYPFSQTWYESDPSDRFWNTIYNVAANTGDPTQSSAMLAALSAAVSLDAGSIFITNLTGSNPYDALPSYWNQEVAAVAAQ